MSSKRRFWLQHIEAWRTTDLSQTEYARQHQLSIKSFSYFRRRYAREPQPPQPETVKAALLPVHIAPEVTAKSEPSDTGISLTCPRGFRIELTTGFDPLVLRQVLNILEAS